jgi:drug/metabolite transporter (DMT)-like permease
MKDDAQDHGMTPYLHLLVTMALFGSAFASSKTVVGELPHQVAAALRFGGGALVLVALAVVLGRRRGPFTRREATRSGLVGLLGVLGYNVLFFWGLSMEPSLDGTIIVPVLSPVLTTILLLVLGRERASAARLAGLALGLAGAVVFFLGVDGQAGESRLWGDLVFLLAAGCWAVYSITSKSLLAGSDPLRATAWGTGIGALGLMALAIPTVPQVEWSTVPAGVWANVVYLAIGPTAIAYLFYYQGLRRVSPSTATIMMFTVPVFGAACSTAFLGESFSRLQAVGAVVMPAGALLAVLGPKRVRQVA